MNELQQHLIRTTSEPRQSASHQLAVDLKHYALLSDDSGTILNKLDEEEAEGSAVH